MANSWPVRKPKFIPLKCLALMYGSEFICSIIAFPSTKFIFFSFVIHPATLVAAYIQKTIAIFMIALPLYFFYFLFLALPPDRAFLSFASLKMSAVA